MKNSQKILLAVLAIVLIAISALIISIKTKKDTNPAVNENAMDEISNTNEHIDAGNTQTKAENNADNSISLTETNAENNKQNINATSNSNNSGNKKPSSQKGYNLSEAELIQTQTTSFGEFQLYYAYSDGKSIYLLVMDTGKKKFFKELPGNYIIENIYYANIDGRFGDEIIIRVNTTPNAEPAIYKNYVLKVTTDSFESLLDTDNLSSGFTATLKSNFNVEITNSKVGFTQNINVKDINDADYVGVYWDENGKLISGNNKVSIEKSFFRFEPQDVDNDGLYELVCSQYVSLGSRKDCIGYANITLKYDYSTKEFNIIKSAFNTPS